MKKNYCFKIHPVYNTHNVHTQNIIPPNILTQDTVSHNAFK